MSNKVTVYEKDHCMQCVQTKRMLDARGIDYDVDDITDPMNLAAAKELGHTSAPVVVVGSESWSGFRPDKISTLAERMKEAA